MAPHRRKPSYPSGQQTLDGEHKQVMEPGFEFDTQIEIECDSARLCVYRSVSQIVQPRLFLMTDVPECSVSLTTRRRGGRMAGWLDGKEEREITRATPLSMPPLLLTPK